MTADNTRPACRPAGRPANGDTPLWPRDAGPSEESAPTPWAWLAALTALSAVLRAIALDQQLWYDEITTLVDSVRHPFAAILTTYPSQNQHVLYALLARASILLFGEHAWTLRLPAVLFGVAGVPALFFFAREIVTRREALLASALLAVSYHHVWFSQNARGYTALLFWTLLASLFFLRGAERTDSRMWVGYAAATALGMYTHLTMAFVAAGHGLLFLWLLAAARRRADAPARPAGGPARRSAGGPRRGMRMALSGFGLAGVATFVLYAPMWPQLVQRTLGQSTPRVESDWTNPLWLVLETLRGIGVGQASGVRAMAIGLALAAAGGLALAGLAAIARQDRYAIGLLLLPGVVTAGALLVLRHNLWPRFFFFLIGFGFLLLVRGAFICADRAQALTSVPTKAVGTGRELHEPVWGVAVVALMLLISAWTLPPAYLYPKQDFLGAMAYVDGARAAGDAVATVGLTTLPYQRYYRRDWPEVKTREELDRVRASANSTWLLYTLPVFVASRHPEVWNAVQSEFTTVRVFRGTLGGGEIYVSKSRSR